MLLERLGPGSLLIGQPLGGMMHTQTQPYSCARVSKIASALRNNHGAVKCCLLALVFLTPLQMWGQDVGAIVGSVTDPSGAVIARDCGNARDSDSSREV